MREKLPYFMMAVIVALFFTCGMVMAQTVNVTFMVNTATVPDTIVSTSSVGLIGSATALGSWSNAVPMTYVGGDYWTLTVPMNIGEGVQYKIRIGSSGWEENTSDGTGNRTLTVPANDTTLMVQYWNNGHFYSGKNIAQYDPPWRAVVPPPDTMTVWVRVDMAGVIASGDFSYDIHNDTLAIRGGGPNGSNLSWNSSLYLTKEQAPTNSANAFTIDPTVMWSGALRIPKDSVNAGDAIQYKFLIGYTWGRDELQGQSNRQFVIPSMKQDTTLQYVYYNNEKPTARLNPDTCLITFTANLQSAVLNKGFAIGDTIVAHVGYFSTATPEHDVQLTRQGLSFNYSATDTVVTSLTKMLDYQYYHVKNGVQIRDNYYNFQYSGSQSGEPEKRQILVSSNTMTVLDTAQSISNARRRPQFPNSTKLSQNVTVTYTVDVRPAIYTLKAGKTLVSGQGGLNPITDPDSIIILGVAMNGPATDTNYTSWATWGPSLEADTAHMMFDDGTHGDLVAGDSIYTHQYLYNTTATLGQVFKFGIGGGDNEGGFGNNHDENINDAATTYTIASQFGSIDPAFYDAWNFDTESPVLGVKDVIGHALQYKLSQNYPNPFNPTTVVEYSLAKESFVTLKVYNLLGQEVMTVVNDKESVGSHSIRIDASRLSTGVYFYKLTAGNFVSTKKMTVMK